MFHIPHLQVQTTTLSHAPKLASLLPCPTGALAWIRDGRGFIAAGEAARFDHRGNGRFEEAAAWWQDILAAADVRDDLQRRATGLLSIGSFSFSPDSSAGSALIIPEAVVGWDGEVGWLTTIQKADSPHTSCLGAGGLGAGSLSAGAQRLADAARASDDSPQRPVHPAQYAGADRYREPVGARLNPGGHRANHRAAVVAIQKRIAAGEAEKVVLARELTLTAAEPIDERYLIAQLAHNYPKTWTFAADGLVGATPELLAATEGREVHVQVLAGTSPRAHEAAEKLRASAKDTHEHQLSVQSVVRELTPLGEVEVGDTFVLELPNVYHLATDIRARLASDVTAVEVAGLLHPTAALGGTPTPAALDIISDVEGIDRGRYGAPVGWMDARGGQWCVALRCAHICENTARAWAGGGILADSDPDVEFTETEAKFAPILGAFSPGA